MPAVIRRAVKRSGSPAPVSVRFAAHDACIDSNEWLWSRQSL